MEYQGYKMSKGTGYIMLDKYLAQEFKDIRREFSIIEAMFSYTLDKDNGKNGSISGYSKLWGWSRWRVRKFIETIHSTTGHYPDRRQTHSRHPIHFIDKGLWDKTDSIPTVSRRLPNTTTNPNPNPNPKEHKSILQKPAFAGQPEPEFYLTKRKRKISGKRLETFELFWKSFGDKRDKANASDSWLDIPSLTDALVLKIIEAAKVYSSNRQSLKDEGNTPKMAQGWLSSRRWEDEQSTDQETDAQYAKRMGI